MTVPALPVPLQSGVQVVRKLVIAQRAGEGAASSIAAVIRGYIGERNVGRINGCDGPVLPASTVAVTVSCSPLSCGAVNTKFYRRYPLCPRQRRYLKDLDGNAGGSPAGLAAHRFSVR